jgi:hypothetical protein
MCKVSKARANYLILKGVASIIALRHSVNFFDHFPSGRMEGTEETESTRRYFHCFTASGIDGGRFSARNTILVEMC